MEKKDAEIQALMDEVNSLKNEIQMVSLPFSIFSIIVFFSQMKEKEQMFALEKNRLETALKEAEAGLKAIREQSEVRRHQVSLA